MEPNIGSMPRKIIRRKSAGVLSTSNDVPSHGIDSSAADGSPWNSRSWHATNPHSGCEIT